MRNLLGLVLICGLIAQSGDPVLAPGDPPLTQSMVNDCLSVIETFLESKLTSEQRAQLQQIDVAIWKNRDKKGMQDLLSNVSYAGRPDALQSVRETNQAAFVEHLRQDPRDPGNAILLAAYDAAHPDRGPVLPARGLGQLVGEWKQQGAITPNRDPSTGRLRGITATDTLLLQIFSDGRFHHLWSHSHCSSGGSTCCRQYATMADGTLSTEGTKLVLEAASGNELFEDACNASSSVFHKIQQTRFVSDWQLRRDPKTGSSTLCVVNKPFSASWEPPPTHPALFCYSKQR